MSDNTLQFDHFKPGLFVTVLKGKNAQIKIMGGLIATVPIEDEVLKGSVLKVQVVDFPFIVIQEMATVDGTDVMPGVVALDLRDYKFGFISKEYVDILIANQLLHQGTGYTTQAMATRQQQANTQQPPDDNPFGFFFNKLPTD